MSSEKLPVDGQSLELTPSVRQGLTAVAVLSLTSFVSTTTLFLYLAYKLAWHACIKQQSNEPKPIQRAVDVTLGIDGIFAEQNNDQKPLGQAWRASSAPGNNEQRKRPRQPPNQFLILIFNLLLADMHQSVAFLLNAEWLRRNAIRVGTPACFVQGLFVSLGDLASSCFITTIAVHTYLSAVKGCRTSQRLLYGVLAAVWVFVYAISTLPIAATRNGALSGGFFVRAGSWCWMNNDYSNLRLLTHYLFIFIGLVTTSVIYISIFINLRCQSRAIEQSGNPITATATQFRPGHNPAFLVYPVIYILCTLPLALGRLATMAGADVPLGYMCFAGVMISSNGVFDCILFGTTRNVIVFASKDEVDRPDTGLDTFTFMQTPRARRYGNMIWVQGGDGNFDSAKNGRVGGWWQLGGGGERSERVRGRRRGAGSRSVSQESLRGPGAILMDRVTTVVVEVEQDKDHRPRYPEPSASASPPVNSTENGMPRILPR